MILRHPVHCPSPHDQRRRGFTITEMLVVVGVIVVLMGILVVALASVRRTSLMTTSMNNLRQISTWMNLYSNDNREFVVPSTFDYSASAAAGNPVRVRSDDSLGPLQYQGTWTDILWTENDVGRFPTSSYPGLDHDYQFDSPDSDVYDEVTDYDSNPFRSSERNSRSVNGGSGPTPFGTGAQAIGEPGYFAANQFFDSTANGFFTNGQVKAPNKSMYAIDSFAGETIEDEPGPFDRQNDATFEVDYRYNDNCLILFLDGSVNPAAPWRDLDELEQTRGVRVRDLDKNP